MSSNQTGLYNHNYEKSSCGVGFITKKDSVQTHEILIKAQYSSENNKLLDIFSK